MNIQQAWVQISPIGIGAILQKSGSGYLTLAYSELEPTDADTFHLAHREIIVYPDMSNRKLWVRASKGIISISVEALVIDTHQFITSEGDIFKTSDAEFFKVS